MCFCNWTISNWFSFIGIILSSGTFVLGIIAYKRFLRNQFRGKQLSEVCDLITQINSEWNHFEFQNVPSELRMGAGNLFDIAEFSEVTTDANFYTFGEESENRFFPYRGVIGSGEFDAKDQTFNDIIAWHFFGFHNHPLLPISIAKVLRKFSVSYWSGNTAYAEVHKEEKYVIMGKKFNKDGKSPCLYYNDKRTWKEYVDLCRELKKVISEWGNKNGLNDLNISFSHNFDQAKSKYTKTSKHT